MRIVRDTNGTHWSVSYICPTEGYPRGHVEIKCGQKTARYEGQSTIVAPQPVLRAVYEEWKEGQSCLDVA